MLNPRKLKKNDVVIERTNRGWSFYGRVWKRHDENHVVVIDCGRYVQIYHEDELEGLIELLQRGVDIFPKVGYT